MNRWYDKYEKLGCFIDGMKDMAANQRDQLVRGIMKIIRKHNPDLLERFVLDFPLELSRQRWYDQDPYLWLTINGLQHAEIDLLETVTLYLEEEYTKNKFNASGKAGVLSCEPPKRFIEQIL
jgi:hypothetical protein